MAGYSKGRQAAGEWRSRKISARQITKIKVLQGQIGMSREDQVQALCSMYPDAWSGSVKDLTQGQAAKYIIWLEARSRGESPRLPHYPSSRDGLVCEIRDLAAARYGDDNEAPLRHLCERICNTSAIEWVSDIAKLRAVRDALKRYEAKGAGWGGRRNA